MKEGLHIDVFQGKDGQWYWHVQAGNGQIVASGAEGFSSRASATRAAQSAMDASEA